jgi:phage terminase small subunit
MSDIQVVKELSDRESVFVENYLLSCSATQAAIAAGLSAHSAKQLGREMANRPHVRAAIRAKMDERSKVTMIDAEDTVMAALEIRERCMQARPVMIFDPIDKTMVQKTTIIKDADGNDAIVGMWEFDSAGANTANKMLMQHTGAIGLNDKGGGSNVSMSDEQFAQLLQVMSK